MANVATSAGNPPERTFLNVKEAAEYLRLSYHTLNTYRCRQIGPRWVRAGARRVVYPLDALNAWLNEAPPAHTSEHAA